MPCRYCHLLLRVLIIFVLLAGPVRAARAESSCSEETYQISAGESLASIAEKCDIPYAALIGINVEISDPNLVYPGQIIRLEYGVPLEFEPASGPALNAGLQADGVYIARQGDSLARIAFLYRTNISSLVEVNPDLLPSQVIVPGQRIQMPKDARLSKGWVGVSTLHAEGGDTIWVRLVDFPPYALVNLNVGEIYDNELIVYDTFTGQADSIGHARIELDLPIYAWSGEEWVIEVVTSDREDAVSAVSPIIYIE